MHKKARLFSKVGLFCMVNLCQDDLYNLWATTTGRPYDLPSSGLYGQPIVRKL